METHSSFTLYFRNIPENYDVPELDQLFETYGEIVKIFVHHNRSYGMVQYDNISSCNLAIECLNNVPPMNMYVSMAKTKSKSDNDLEISSSQSSCSSRNGSTYNRTQSKLEEAGSDMRLLAVDDFLYLDRFNQPIPACVTDDGVVYLPADRVTGFKSVFIGKPADCENNEDTFINHRNNSDFKDDTNFSGKQQQNMARRSYQPGTNRGNRHNYGQQSDTFNSSFGEERVQQPRQNNRLVNRPQSRNPFNNQRPLRQNHYERKPVKEDGAEQDWSQPEGTGNGKTDGRLDKEVIVKREPSPAKRTAAARQDTNGTTDQRINYKTIVLPENEFTEVFVLQEVDSTRGWVQIVSQMDMNDQLGLRVAEEAETAKPVMPAVGSLCFAKFEEFWFRAVVLTTKPTVRVRYIDYGNESEEPEGGLLGMSADLAAVPGQALCIALVDGAPTEVSAQAVLRVKPVNVVLDVVYVLVENGIYDTSAPVRAVEERPKKPVEQKPKCAGKSVVPVRPHNDIVAQMKVGYSGLMEPTIWVTDGEFVASFMPVELGELLSQLITMKDTCKPDTSFKAELGALVGAEYKSDGWSRAVLLKRGASKGDQHTLAYVDYGQVATAGELRPVPTPFVDVPEFSCVCTVLPKYVSQIKKQEEGVSFIVLSITGTTAIVQISGQETDICTGSVTAWQPAPSEVAVAKVEQPPSPGQSAAPKVYKREPGSASPGQSPATVNAKLPSPGQSAAPKIYKREPGSASPGQSSAAVNAKLPSPGQSAAPKVYKREPGSASPGQSPAAVNAKLATTPDQSPAAAAVKMETVSEETEHAPILSSGDKVQLMCENEGYVYVRTKRGHQLLQQITEKIKVYAKTAPLLQQRPKVSQFVAAFYEDGWYRAVVKSISGDLVTVCYIDYGNEEAQPWPEMKVLSLELNRLPFTLSKVRLMGRLQANFSQAAIKYLAQLAEIKAVLTVTFDGAVENGVCLTLKDGRDVLAELNKLEPAVEKFTTNAGAAPNKTASLLKVLKSKSPKPPAKKQFNVPDADSPRIWVTDLPPQSMPLGGQRVQVLHHMNLSAGCFSFCPDDRPRIRQLHRELMADIREYVLALPPGTPPYAPLPEELILVRHDDEWRRGLFMEEDEGEMCVFHIDYGQTDIVPKDHIRRISTDFTSLESIAFLGVLRDIPVLLSDACLSRLGSLILVGSVHEVDIVAKDEEDMYSVSIDAVTRALRTEHLI